MKSAFKITRRQLLAAMAASPLAGATRDQESLASRSESPELFYSPKSRTIRIEAKPEPITIDIARTGVIVVDMQNDFGSRGGLFDRVGLDITGIQKVIAPTAKVLTSARRTGINIIYLKMGFLPDLSDLFAPDSPNRLRSMRNGIGKSIRAPNGTEGRILIRDTWNTDIVSELKPQPNDTVIYKHRFSGFYQTDLDKTLKTMWVKNLVITGCTTSVCVESTVRDAMFRDYTCVLLADCMAEPVRFGLPKSSHETSLLIMQTMFGWVTGSDEFVKALEVT